LLGIIAHKKPLTDLQKGVSPERIKGAALTGAALGFLAGNGIFVSGVAGLGAAYLAISKGVTGDVFRTVGGIAWDVTDTATSIVDKLSSDERFNVMTKDLTEKAWLAFRSTQNSSQYLEYMRSNATAGSSEIYEAEKAFLASQEELARVLKEAEAVIDEADEAIAKAQVELKLNNQQPNKDDEDATMQLQQVIDSEKELQLAGDDRVAGNSLENEDLAEARKLEDELHAEQMSLTEEKWDKKDVLAEEARLAKGDETLEEKSDKKDVLAEEARLAKGDETLEGGGIVLDDDEWITAVEIAQEGLEGKIVGIEEMIADSNAKAEWDAAGTLARELQRDTMPYNDDAEDDVFEYLDLDALGKAAREAVESFETDMKVANNARLDQKRKWASSMATDNVSEVVGVAKVEVNGFRDDNGMDEEVSEAQPNLKDWSSMTVAQLREELKTRGLKTNGKKAELIAVLQKDEAEIFGGGSVNGNGDAFGRSSELDSDFTDFEELGRQARAAVQLFQIKDGVLDEEPTEEMLAQLETEMASIDGYMEQPMADFAQMTVEQLKDECRRRGLMVGGKKSDLIARLEILLG
jgi:hypothetical protein